MLKKYQVVRENKICSTYEQQNKILTRNDRTVNESVKFQQMRISTLDLIQAR